MKSKRALLAAADALSKDETPARLCDILDELVARYLPHFVRDKQEFLKGVPTPTV